MVSVICREYEAELQLCTYGCSISYSLYHNTI
jgi:hypothetical protein